MFGWLQLREPMMGHEIHIQLERYFDPEPLNRLIGRPIPQHDPEGVSAVELVVAVTGEDEGGHGAHPATEQSKNVQRGFVRPVHVF